MPEFLSSEFIQQLASNTDIMKLILDNENDTLIVKDGYFKLNDLSKLSKLKLVLCDVKIEMNNSKCIEDKCRNTDTTSQKTNKSSEYICREDNNHSTHKNSRSKYNNKKLLFDIDRKDISQNTYIGKQEKISFNKIEEIKKLLKEIKNSKIEIENLEKELYKKNKSVNVSERLLRHQQKKKIAIQSKIETISSILSHSHKSFENKLVNSYKKEITTLKNDLNKKNMQIKKIEKFLSKNEEDIETLKKIINKKNDKLFQNLFNYNI